MMDQTLNLFYVTFDGVESFYCGVGACTRYFLAGVPDLRTCLQKCGLNIVVHVVYPTPPRSCTKHAEFRHVNDLARLADVRLHPLPAEDGASNPFGTIDHWPKLCRQIMQLVEKNAQSPVIILANDTPFAGLGQELHEHRTKLDIHLVWIAQSTSKVWAIPGTLALDEARSAWEDLAIEAATLDKRCFVGATSDYMNRHLISELGCPPERILDTTNGVEIEYLRRQYGMRQSDIATLLKKYQIPTDRPLFVSFGRAGIHKGLDFAYKVGERLATLDIAYPVILGSDWGTRESESGRLLLSDKSTGSSDAGVVLTDFSFDLPKFLMQWNGTRLLAVFSRREPFGLIPSEFRVLNGGSGVIAVSNIGGLAEQVSNYIDGVLVDVDSINNASDVCGHSLTEPKLDCEGMHRIGLERVSRDYIMHRNILAVIKKLLKL